MLLKYYLSAVSAFVIWGLFSLALKPLSSYASLDILLYRVLIASACILFFSLFIRRKVTWQNWSAFKTLAVQEKRNIVLNNLVSAILLAINWYLFIHVMNHVSVNATSLAYLICPILTTMLAFILLKEHLSTIQKTAVLLSLVSCLLLSIGHFIDLFYSFIIAFSYALYLILQKKNNRLDKFFTLTIQIVLSTILLLPLFSVGNASVEKGALFYSLVTLIAILFTIVPLYLNTLALKGLDSSVVGILLYLNPILSFLLAIFYFGEHVEPLQIISYALIFMSVMLFNSAVLISRWKSRRLSVSNTCPERNTLTKET